MTGGVEPDPANRRVWMAEDYLELGPTSPWTDFEKVQFCFEGVRRAECFVAIIANHHGTHVRLGKAGSVPFSFFEAELMQAGLLRKPSFVFLLRGHEPEEGTARRLKLLKPFFPDMNLWPASEDQILRQVEQLIANYQRPRWLRRIERPRANEALLALFRERHSPYDVKRAAPSLRFLNGSSNQALPRPDAKPVDAILQRASEEQDYHNRMMLLWFAIRSLKGAPFNDETSIEFLSLWDRALQMWNSAAAWFGLHGWIDVGCVAALGTLADVRLRLSQITGMPPALPHGAFASAYYSAARLAPDPKELLALSLSHVEAEIEETKDTSGPLAIRGSIYREMGLKEASIRDYQRVVDLRRERDDASYGEALSELGYAYVRFGNPRQGVALMEQGLECLNRVPASGFHVRAIRKLAIGYARCRKFASALDRAVEAHDMAEKLGTLDQIRTVERLAARIDAMRRWRR